MRIPAWTDRVLWRRRRPRSKFTTVSDDLSVDEGDGKQLLDLSSDSEDEEDEKDNVDQKDNTDQKGIG